VIVGIVLQRFATGDLEAAVIFARVVGLDVTTVMAEGVNLVLLGQRSLEADAHHVSGGVDFSLGRLADEILCSVGAKCRDRENQREYDKPAFHDILQFQVFSRLTTMTLTVNPGLVEYIVGDNSAGKRGEI